MTQKFVMSDGIFSFKGNLKINGTATIEIITRRGTAARTISTGAHFLPFIVSGIVYFGTSRK